MHESGLHDSYGRHIEYMRLSLTDRCNFRCLYCMPSESENFVPHEAVLSYEELLRVCRVSASLGIRRYKITGGEPLCRKGAVECITRLGALPGVEEITLTTNGALLEPHLDALADAGLRSVTVSLDSLSQPCFEAITRSTARLDPILRGMAAARDRGLRVKINTVALKGYNDAELTELVGFALTEGYHIRFIELMPVGGGRTCVGLPQEEIRKRVERRFGPLLPEERPLGNGPAEYFRLDGYAASIGFISALSKKFCSSCNRVRLTSLGYLKTCLHHSTGVDLRPLLRSGRPDDTDDALAQALLDAVAQKPKDHQFCFQATPQELENFSMNSVGG